MMDRIYLCDIDGTLANHSPHRSPYDENKVHLDTPLPTCEVIKDILCEKDVIFFSGRSSNCYNSTKIWLSKHLGIPEPSIKLYMRNTGDNRADDIIKEELYETHIKGKYNVIGVFDDRLKVCRMWYKLGLFVFNCNQGLKEF